MQGGQLRGVGVSVGVLIAALALAFMPAHAKAASPVLEFVTPGSAFPVSFTATGGPVTAELAGFDSVVHCTGSNGAGKITGPRSTLSDFEFTGCKAQGGTHNDQECKSEGADAEEITAEAIEADLVYIDQAKHEVGMLLNPDGGTYMTFKCGGELVEASGPFLSPVGPINKAVTSFTATLSQSDAAQTPNEYENAIGEKRHAIPMGKRAGDPTPATTGVELSFTIDTNVSIQIEAVTAAEIEARRHEDEAAAKAAEKKRHDEEAAATKAAKKRQEEEAATAAVVKERQEEEFKSELLKRAQLSSTIKQCKKAPSKRQRVRCITWAKKTYGSAKQH